MSITPCTLPSRRLEDKLEPQLKRLLQAAGAEEYLTMFANGSLTFKQVLYMDDGDLLEVRPGSDRKRNAAYAGDSNVGSDGILCRARQLDNPRCL